MSRRTDLVVMVAVVLLAAGTAFWLRWPAWAAGLLALPAYAGVWAVARAWPGRQKDAEPADLRLVRVKRRA